MYSKITSGTIYGMEGCLIQVEVDISPGLPCFVMVGSLSSEIRESAERVRIALKNNGISLPPSHISVNLSPADIRKEGTAFDLPVAVAVLTAMGKLEVAATEQMLLLGELGLNGEIRPVRGVLPIVRKSQMEGIKTCLIPKENRQEAEFVENIRIVPVETISEVIRLLSGCEAESSNDEKNRISVNAQEGSSAVLGEFEDEDNRMDFSQIAGQESAKRAAVIAAAGFHNLLITGSPGSGKTMIARRLPGILPPLSKEESLEVASIYSVAGLLDEKRLYSKNRPFLDPHHTITASALTGGGKSPRPGIISLAHRGVLFLDELPEFKRQTLDIMRQPLEERTIRIARVYGNFTYPADFMLVGAMNPCPCGYFPDRNKCRCTPFEIHKYVSHISGPVLDRIDLCVEAGKLDYEGIRKQGEGESSESMRSLVIAARQRQKARFAGTSIRFNSEIGTGELEQYCRLTEKAEKLMEKLFQKLDLSARAYHRVLRVARTIADVDGEEEIGERQLSEAACYYSMGRSVFYDEA